MPNPVVHFEILGKDTEATQSFYASIFDWPMEKVMDTYAMRETRGRRWHRRRGRRHDARLCRPFDVLRGSR